MSHLSVLDTAGEITVNGEPVVRPSVVEDRGLHYAEPIGPRYAERQIRLRWRPATFAQLQRIRDHFEANQHGAFQVQIPGGDAVWVAYTSPPRWSPRTPITWDVDVTLTETFRG